jgi:hypothetical protein
VVALRCSEGGRGQSSITPNHESYFRINGYMNTQNMLVWSSEYPLNILETPLPPYVNSPGPNPWGFLKDAVYKNGLNAIRELKQGK